MKKAVLAVMVALTAQTVVATDYHVSSTGHDSNSGADTKPLQTISAAAAVAQPGDVITVHAGVYRERVAPPRGGTSEDDRIVYRAAPGEQVVLKGSEIIKGWVKVHGDVWKVSLPNSFFGAFNPYEDTIGGEWYSTPKDGFDRHTGAVYLNGQWLDEAPTLEHLMAPASSAVRDRVLGGRTASYAGKAISATDDDILYQTCRYNLQGYRLSVPNGVYRVTLKFCEPHFESRGARVFDVRLQGRKVLSQFDILAQVGPFTAHDQPFDRVEVANGELAIDIINRTSLGCISGIVVEDQHFSKRINCGGPAWRSFEKDTGRKTRFTHDRPLWFAGVDAEHTTIWAQFENVDPNTQTVEINVRQSIFYPERPGCNYITVSGFTMRHAATPWSGAMSEQIGLIGTFWSKGWVIEDNVISHSMNTGITLGRYQLQNAPKPPATAEGYVRSIELALENGWSKERIGNHVVRNNHISFCEKNGIHGSLGGIFSIIENNTICDIATRGWIHGPDVAGLKLLGSQDVTIRDNHICRCKGVGGIWLDWMAQGTRVTGNLLHDNSQDLFMEVNHGPFLIDNNLFCSANSLRDWSQGGAFVHNLFVGTITPRQELKRQTPYHRPHSTMLAGLSNIRGGDHRYFNNMIAGPNGLVPYDKAAQPMHVSGNAYLAGAKPSDHDQNAWVALDLGSRFELEEDGDGWWIVPTVDRALSSQRPRTIVTTESLGRTIVSGAPFESPDGAPYRLDTDYFGRSRNIEDPAPGPFFQRDQRKERFKVWPKDPPGNG